MVTQAPYTLLTREIDGELLPSSVKMEIGTIGYNPLAGGLLTGKHSPDRKPEGGLALA